MRRRCEPGRPKSDNLPQPSERSIFLLDRFWRLAVHIAEVPKTLAVHLSLVAGVGPCLAALLACTSEVVGAGYPGGASAGGGSANPETNGSGGSGSGGGAGTSSSATVGSVGGGGSETEPGGVGNPTVAPTEFECDETLVVESPAWRRLTRVQYENTVRDLLDHALGDSIQALDVYSSLGSLLDSLPNDERPKVQEDLHGTYRRLDQGVAQSHVDNWYAVAGRIAEQLTVGSRLASVVGACGVEDSETAECVRGLVEDFGARALRRPLSDEEVDFFIGFYGDTSAADPAGYADVIAGLLNAPQFLYMVEHGSDQAGAAPVFELDAFELASRLSYHFWNTMPDDELWQAALDGSLSTPEVYEAQVERLFGDARTRASIEEFYREWLKLENLPRLDQANDVPVFQAFAGDELPSSMLHESMNQEVIDLLSFLSLDQGGSFEELLTTQLIKPEAAELAALYGVEPVSSPIAAPNGDRPGLLTRAQFLATGSANTRPIMKGVFIRENVLCDHIPSPPGDAAAVVPELSPELSTREVVESLTEQPNTVCSNCHTQLINPLGFATENYDALGRVRSEQRLFDESGEEVGRTPIETSSVPRVTSDDETSVDEAEGLMRLILESGKGHACLARHYFRFSFGRWEHVVNDGCALEQLRSALFEGGSLVSMLREVALSPSFRQRSIE